MMRAPEPRTVAPVPQESTLSRPASPLALFTSFTLLAIQGFGGVLALAQDMLVERRRWLDTAQFVDMLSIAQVLPGPNICNVSLIIGNRFFGLRGALAALGGLLTVPLLLVLAAALLYARYQDLAAVGGAVRGMGAVAAGMVIGTALRLGGSLARNPMGLGVCGVLALTTFVLVGLLRIPLLEVLAVLASLGIWLAWRALRRASPVSGAR